MAEIGHNSDAANPGNWIALSRDVREHPIVGAGQTVKAADDRRGAWSRMEAWFDLLCLAQFRPSRINNKGEVQTLDVGQLMGARAYLAARWNWTEKTVRYYLDALEAEGMISRGGEESENQGQQNGQRKANKCSVITVCNYGKYQLYSDAIEEYLRQAKGPARGQQGASAGPAKGHNLTSKTLQQDSPPTPSGGSDEIAARFAEFWAAFPGAPPPRGRKTDKPKVLDAFRRIVAGTHRRGLRASAAEIIAGANRYAASNPDPDFIPMPLTWLNGGRWGDESLCADTPAAASAWWRNPDRLAEMTPERWRTGIAQYANGTWPTAKLGPPPGHHECVVPDSIIAELRLTDRYTPAGISREKH